LSYAKPKYRCSTTSVENGLEVKGIECECHCIVLHSFDEVFLFSKIKSLTMEPITNLFIISFDFFRDEGDQILLLCLCEFWNFTCNCLI